MRTTRMFCRGLLYLCALLPLTACMPVQVSSKGAPAPTEQLAMPGFVSVPQAADTRIKAGTYDDGTIGGPTSFGSGDGGSFVTCDTQSGVLQTGQTLTLRCSSGGGSSSSGSGSAPSYTLGGGDAPAGSDIGTLVPAPGGGVIYQAPGNVSQGITVTITVEGGTDGGTIQVPIQIVPPGEIGVIDDGTTRGGVGNVYQVEPWTPQIPNLNLYQPVQTVVMPNIDMANRPFDLGFPGVRDLVEWFCIRFDGRISFPVTGDYVFDLAADDGANFYLDDAIVVNNDGIHSVQTKRGQAHVAAGMHRFRVDYYQGPRHYIALQLFWKRPGDTAMVIIPPDNFYRP